MLDKLLSAAATNAKLALAAAAGAALVAGGSAVAITNVADSGTPSATVVDDHASDQGKKASAARGDNRSETATATIDLPKPAEPGDEADEAKPTDNHGACVSAAAHSTTATGRDRGQAISTIAKSDCGKSDAAKGEDDEDAAASTPAKPAKPAKAKPAAPTADDDDADDDEDSDDARGAGTKGAEKRDEHARK